MAGVSHAFWRAGKFSILSYSVVPWTWLVRGSRKASIENIHSISNPGDNPIKSSSIDFFLLFIDYWYFHRSIDLIDSRNSLDDPASNSFIWDLVAHFFWKCKENKASIRDTTVTSKGLLLLIMHFEMLATTGSKTPKFVEWSKWIFIKMFFSFLKAITVSLGNQ